MTRSARPAPARRRTVLVALTAVVAAGLLAGCTESTSAAAPATPHPSATTRAWDHAPGERIVVIGDSITAGHGLTPEQAWPSLLARTERWQLTNFSCDGAGVVAEGDADECASAYPTLVRRAVDERPQVVFIQASSNDLGEDDAVVKSQTDQLVAEVHRLLPAARVVGLSAIWNEQAPPAQLAKISHAMHRAARKDGGTYVDIGDPLRGHADWMQSDDVHPTARGQRAIEASVIESFARDRLRF
ncbi:SGNH/GDSL hydrolase family protein [Curtobacterium sp. C1]|uniref:SGNH/GDSL hydrolase family protein n=1 Tax=Curtobacterium TaxID=2034 RepID=UPI001E5E8278|nr:MULTISPECIES: SGNH/GDSL hydrolase family protein [Curtobacterium]UFU13226.1 SGNH/GDSL hydrolase family protein [Curtobacterium sp. C1]WIJ44440.1 SGNH/GDSL hydrolase family protein [Curtobacterium citreum]